MFPYEKFTINSFLNPHLVRQKLLDVVEPPKAIRWGFRQSEKPYEGEIGEHSFMITRIINYRNSFLPVIKGKISPEGMGSKIEIEMKLHTFVFVFILFWLGMVGNICIFSLISIIYEKNFSSGTIIPFLMFIFVFLLTSIAFKTEANIAKKFLIDLLS
ncbi:hypothetical protein BCD67_10840 [Oscillatoriales cyanobacterium USR001]|nr:hypothetical protein BCD67_10840 [Oscillatoriales cyanobacterium USR001]